MVTNDPPTGDADTKIWYKWIFGQPAYIVILVGLMVAIGYTVVYVTPNMLTQIQEGYEKIESQHRAERKEVREDVKADRKDSMEALENNSRALENNNRLLEQIHQEIIIRNAK